MLTEEAVEIMDQELWVATTGEVVSHLVPGMMVGRLRELHPTPLGVLVWEYLTSLHIQDKVLKIKHRSWVFSL